jgi:hypothetical protein
MAKKGGKRLKLVVGKDPTPDEEEEIIENAWKTSGDLHVIAGRLARCRMRNEPPPEWVHKALLDLADASTDLEPYRRLARRQARYVAVREAHDREGLSWEKAPVRAAEMLRGQPAEAKPSYMWKEYCTMRKALRDAGAVRDDDDPGYRWVDLPDKS